MRTRLIVVFAVVVAAIAVPASPSAATGISGYTIVSETTEADSISPKEVRVSCPEDKVVLGSGADLGFVDDDVHITGVVPGGRSVTAFASERDGGLIGNWYLKVIAVCADPVAGREVVSDTSYSTDGPDALVGVGCSDDKMLLDASARVSDAYTLARQPTLPDIVVNYIGGSEDYAVAQAFEDEDGTSTRWVLVTYAICADPIVGLEQVTEVGGYLSEDTRSKTAHCPTGKRVLGGGAHVFTGGSNGNDGEVSLMTLNPVTYQNLSYYTVGAAEDRNGLSDPGSWRLDAWAVCAPVFTAIPR
ncbi:MAG: hypothetical protein OES13_08315 [Acidimicrobiia bacterium]|nr:hypothetical protein [Acidimicrobiia bacterium]